MGKCLTPFLGHPTLAQCRCLHRSKSIRVREHSTTPHGMNLETGFIIELNKASVNRKKRHLPSPILSLIQGKAFIGIHKVVFQGKDSTSLLLSIWENIIHMEKPLISGAQIVE